MIPHVLKGIYACMGHFLFLCMCSRFQYPNKVPLDNWCLPNKKNHIAFMPSQMKMMVRIVKCMGVVLVARAIVGCSYDPMTPSRPSLSRLPPCPERAATDGTLGGAQPTDKPFTSMCTKKSVHMVLHGRQIPWPF